MLTKSKTARDSSSYYYEYYTKDGRKADKSAIAGDDNLRLSSDSALAWENRGAQPDERVRGGRHSQRTSTGASTSAGAAGNTGRTASNVANRDVSARQQNAQDPFRAGAYRR